MLRRTAVILALCALVLSIPACARIEPQGRFPREASLTATSIAADWGNLVAASTSAEQPDLTQLWFQDASGNIRMVLYNVRDNTLLNVTLFRRQ